MPAFLTSFSTMSLMALTALGYALATVGMKHATYAPGVLAVTLISAGLIAAVLAEVALLRNGNLSLVYLGIIVAESALVLGYAMWIDQGLSFRQMFGAVLVLGGIMVLSTQH